MFISRKFYELLSSSQAEARTLSEQNKVLQSTLDWARYRITQLEKERAQLLYAVSGAKIAVPEFVQTPTEDSTGDFLHSLPSMEDIGDDAASILGVGWDREGSLVSISPKLGN